MHLTMRDAARQGARRPWLVASLSLGTFLGAAALPAVSLAAPHALLPTLVWADPDTGYWIELIVVAIVTAVAGIVFNVRRKPDR